MDSIRFLPPVTSLAQVKGYIRCKSRAMKALVECMMKVLRAGRAGGP